MSFSLGSLAWLLASIAMICGGGWLLCIRLPAERRRVRRMLPATGTIEDGLSPSNVFKKISSVAEGADAAAVPMVRFATREGVEVLASVGAVRGGRGAERPVFTIGSPVPLVYDPEDPKVVVLDGQPTRIAFFGMLCAFLLVSGVLGAYAALRDLGLFASH